MTTARKISSVILSMAWPILILGLPLVMFAASSQWWVLLLLPILASAHQITYGKFLPLTQINLSILVLVIMVGVSLIASFDLAYSFPKVVGLMYGLAIFYAVTSTANQSIRHYFYSNIVQIMMGVGVALIALLGTQWSSKLPAMENIIDFLPINWISLPGADSGFNSNEVAGVLLWSFPLAVSVASLSIFRRKELSAEFGKSAVTILQVGSFISASLLFFVLLLTQSRSALIGISFSLLLMFLALLRLRKKGWLKILIPLSAIIVIGALYLLLTTEMSSISEESDLYDRTELSFLEARQEIWSRALYGIEDFPITGMGMGTFRRVVHVLYPLFLISPNNDIGHAHNNFLQTALDLGIVGMVAYASIWIGTGAAIWHSWKRANAPILQYLTIGLAGCLVAYFLYGITDTVALGARPGFLFWSLIGLAVAGSNMKTDGKGLTTSSE